ncbi:unnamed protein product [Bursaphelenchus xylophilus]|uniref:(pine wood nematode) hypothetical protein n=1 Tax=Bursaphelenchus xylophilus TaxID=6326 RepID=A0A1I7RZS2_BURXY|nr:unnamed protein product [Bursaphelenchus xylophilus]CAG9111662.1 unnamed protein product [Bursaphelenchus xylophilus]
MIVAERTQSRQPMANFIIEFFWFNDILGSVLGVILSSLLIFAVFQRRDGKTKQLHPYSRMVLVMAVNDFFFCFVEVNVQHILAFGNYKMFVNAHGTEYHFLSSREHPYSFMVHVFFLMNTITLLPAVYSYRYELMKNPAAAESWSPLLRRVFISCALSFICATCGWLAVHRALQNGHEYYLQFLPDAWIDEHNHTNFVYPVDVENPEGVSWVAALVIESALCIVGAVYYAAKAYALVNHKSHFTSARTKSMQTQFTRSIIAQTLTVILMANMPAGAVLFCICFGFKSNYVGTLILWPFSWVSAVASLLTFYFIRDYRRWLFNKFGYEGEKSTYQSSNISNITKTSLH